MDQLAGKVAVVRGAASGIGPGLVLRQQTRSGGAVRVAGPRPRAGRQPRGCVGVVPGKVRTNFARADRNRPRDLVGDVSPRSKKARALMRRRHSLAAGIEAGEVASQVVEAIRTNRFYVFTHPEHMTRIRARFETVLAAQGAPARTLPG